MRRPGPNCNYSFAGWTRFTTVTIHCLPNHKEAFDDGDCRNYKASYD